MRIWIIITGFVCIFLPVSAISSEDFCEIAFSKLTALLGIGTKKPAVRPIDQFPLDSFGPMEKDDFAQGIRIAHPDQTTPINSGSKVVVRQRWDRAIAKEKLDGFSIVDLVAEGAGWQKDRLVGYGGSLSEAELNALVRLIRWTAEEKAMKAPSSDYAQPLHELGKSLVQLIDLKKGLGTVSKNYEFKQGYEVARSKITDPNAKKSIAPVTSLHSEQLLKLRQRTLQILPEKEITEYQRYLIEITLGFDLERLRGYLAVVPLKQWKQTDIDGLRKRFSKCGEDVACILNWAERIKSLFT